MREGKEKGWKEGSETIGKGRKKEKKEAMIKKKGKDERSQKKERKNEGKKGER